MVRLKTPFCVTTTGLREKMHDGREDEARQEAIALLRSGFASKGFLMFVAELLDPPPRGRGQPARPPKRWLEIGERYAHVYGDSGKTHEVAVEELAAEFGMSERTIRRAVTLYRKAKKEHDDSTAA